MSSSRSWIVLAVWVALACSRTDQHASESAGAPSVESTPAPAASEDPGPSAPVFTGLETREHQLWLHVGGRYTVKSEDGRLLAEEIDAARLERDYPELHELVNGILIDTIDDYER